MNKKVKAILIGLLAIVTATGAAFGIAAQKRGAVDEKATYRSSVQTQNEPSENEANEANETSEENEAGEQDKTAEANKTSEENEVNQADEANEANEADETAESGNLQSSAKITPEQAKSAALAQIPGTVKSVQLENEEGSVVYAVVIQIADGGIREVIVDAGSGKVLPAESDAENDGESD